MNNRFKFRAKLKNIDNWVYGAYLKMLPYQPNPVGHRKPLEAEYKHLIITEGSADWGMPREIAAYEVVSETVGQCTGLKDKNGKLIYEGDIVKFNYDTDEIIAVVSWDDNEGQVGYYLNTTDYFKDKYVTDYDFYKNDYEVLGNIYENPELLEVSNEK